MKNIEIEKLYAKGKEVLTIRLVDRILSPGLLGKESPYTLSGGKLRRFSLIEDLPLKTRNLEILISSYI